MQKKKIIGLAGEIASGKGTVAEYIKNNYRGSLYRFSTILRDILDRLYLKQSRENMQKLSTAMRENYGQDLFSKVLNKDIKNDSAEIIVIDGIRRESDIKCLKKMDEFKLVYIEVDIKTRHRRITNREENSDDKNKSFEQFSKDHSGEAEAQIKGLKNIADEVIDNNGSLDELYKQVDEILKLKDKISENNNEIKKHKSYNL